MKTFHIQWHLSNVCNLRCRHCYQEDYNTGENTSLSLLKKETENIFEFLKASKKVLTVDLTGGEPLIFPYFWDVLSILQQSEFVKKIGLITNGTMLDENIIKKLSCHNKLKTIKISCEGCEKTSYEYFRGASFEKFLSTLKIVKDFPGEKMLIFTLMEENTSQVPLLFNLVEKFGLSGFIIERFFPMGRGKIFEQKMVSLKSWKHICEYLLYMCGFDEGLDPVLPYRGFMLKKNKKWKIFGSECIVGKDGCALMGDGSIYPCRRFNLIIGNIREQKLMDIWNDSFLPSLRKRKNLKGKCRTCNVKTCYGCRALAYCMTGDFYQQDPLCFRTL